MHQNILAEFLSEFGLQLLNTKVDPDCITISASIASLSASCPQCHSNSSKVHSGYIRTLADLSLGVRKMVVYLERVMNFEPSMVNSRHGTKNLSKRCE